MSCAPEPVLEYVISHPEFARITQRDQVTELAHPLIGPQEGNSHLAPKELREGESSAIHLHAHPPTTLPDSKLPVAFCSSCLVGFP